MLLLLAGKLGVREMTYSSTITETIYSKIAGSINIKGLDTKLQYAKSKLDKETTTGYELYQNRGASVYINSKNKQDIDTNIMNSLGTMKSKIFSYDYYKNSQKLESFVYKRYVFKMLQLEYTIDVEDISEKSFIVKTCFMNYGFSVIVDKNTSYNESIHYKFDFFSDRDLRIQLLEQLRQEEDNFLIIREVYNETKDKDTAVHYIANYVKNQADKIQYANKLDMSVNTFKDILDRWITKNSTGNFYSMCHNFTNSIQIIDWIYSLINADINDIDIDIVDNIKYNPIEKKVFFLYSM